MSTTMNIIEDFPSLPIQKNKTKKERSPSVGSSVSSSSIGAFRDQKTRRVEVLSKGTYIGVEDLIVRPHLRCHCERCGTERLTESAWASKRCQRAFTKAVDSGFVCKVLDSKVIHHRVGFKHSKFSVARIQWEEEREVVKDGKTTTEVKIIRGWCFSKCLQETHKQRISESTARSVSNSPEVDRSRSNSVASSFRSSPFMLGEPVLVRIEDGVKQEKAFVRNVTPLQVVVEGTGQVVSHVGRVTKLKTRNFVVTRDVSVRENQIDDGWTVKTSVLKKGTTIAVSYTSGHDGFVTSPVCGWITMRSEHSLNVVNENYVYQEQNPTIFVKNLPGDLTEAQLRKKLLWKLQVNPKDIRFESNGTLYRAVLTLVSHIEALKLVERKAFEIHHGWNLSFSWDLRYLQKCALSR